MAHAATITALVDSLVKSLTRLDPVRDARTSKKARDAAVRGLRSPSHARTNQFDVHGQMKGLEEKFFVLNRDDLALALRLRLEELDQKAFQLAPEVLSLLLSLSDQPARYSTVDRLAWLRPAEEAQPLTWAAILEDDPLEEDGVWNDIDYTAESTGDENEIELIQPKCSKRISSTHSEEYNSPDACLIPAKHDSVEELRVTHFWRDDSSQPSFFGQSTPKQSSAKGPRLITELQAIREVLFMLSGLPTSLFTFFDNEEPFGISRKYKLAHISTVQFHAILEEFAVIGSSIIRLRHWSEQDQDVSLLQTFQSEVDRELSLFDKDISDLHQRYLHTNPGILVSLQQLLVDMTHLTKSLQSLSEVVVHVTVKADLAPHTYLERLFQATNIAQSTGQHAVYTMLGAIFFNCFQTYLKPIRNWMDCGSLGLAKDSFFVHAVNQNTEVSSLWHDQFKLKYDERNQLYAPDFLRPTTKRILNAGKAVVFLQRLAASEQDWARIRPEPALTFHEVCQGPRSSDIEPFANLFTDAFDSWIQSKHNSASDVLRQHLFEQCGLWRTLDALEYVFLSKDGAKFQTFADTIFEKLDARTNTWNDPFVLTDVAQQIFGNIPAVEATKVCVRTIKPRHKEHSVNTLSSIILDYSLPWPLLNVIKQESLLIYQRIACLILQSYRAKYLLQRCSWLSRLSKSRLFKEGHDAQLGVYLRHRLIWFADNVRSYVTEVVISKRTAETRALLSKAEDIDEMAKIHGDYMLYLEEQCLLSRNLAPIFQSILSILDLAIVVHDAFPSQSRSNLSEPRMSDDLGSLDRTHADRRKRRGTASDTSSADSEYDDDGYSGDDEDASSMESLTDLLKRAREQFDRLCPFVMSGLKSISRSRSDQNWQILAEKLQWQVEVNNDY